MEITGHDHNSSGSIVSLDQINVTMMANLIKVSYGSTRPLFREQFNSTATLSVAVVYNGSDNGDIDAQLHGPTCKGWRPCCISECKPQQVMYRPRCSCASTIWAQASLLPGFHWRQSSGWSSTQTITIGEDTPATSDNPPATPNIR